MQKLLCDALTGGSTGIGLGLAEKFLAANSTVIVTGRRAEVLEAAKAKFSKLHTRVSDAGSSSEREELAQWATSNFSGLNILVRPCLFYQ